MKNSTKGALIVGIMALVMTVSLVGGYKFITHISPKVKTEFDNYTNPITEQLKKDFDIPEKKPEDESKKAGSGFAYTGTVKRAYDGPVIYQEGGYIFNSDGKILTDYKSDKGYDIRLTKSIDGSRAVLLYEDKALYIDADLNVTEISSACKLTGMSFEGRYFFYIQQEGSKQVAYIHDVDEDVDYQIAESKGMQFRSVCISPDGRTLVYSMYDDKTVIHVKGIDTEEKVYDTDDCDSIITVSNDGETVFYSSYDHKTEYHCLHQGKVTDLGTKNYRHDYLDRECKQILYQDDKDTVKYYRAGDKKPIVLLKDDDASIKLGNVARQEQDIYMEDYVLDTDCFSDAVVLTADHKWYALYGETPEAIDLGKKMDKVYSYEVDITKEGPTWVYYKTGSFYKAVFDGKELNNTTILEPDDYMNSFTCSPDLTKMWVKDRRHIYYIEEGKEPELVVEAGDDSSLIGSELEWDPLEDRCCYVLDNEMYSVGVTSDSKLLMKNCKFLSSSSYDEFRLVTAYDTDSNLHIVVGGQAYQLR